MKSVGKETGEIGTVGRGGASIYRSRGRVWKIVNQPARAQNKQKCSKINSAVACLFFKSPVVFLECMKNQRLVKMQCRCEESRLAERGEDTVRPHCVAKLQNSPARFGGVHSGLGLAGESGSGINKVNAFIVCLVISTDKIGRTK